MVEKKITQIGNRLLNVYSPKLAGPTEFVINRPMPYSDAHYDFHFICVFSSLDKITPILHTSFQVLINKHIISMPLSLIYCCKSTKYTDSYSTIGQ